MFGDLALGECCFLDLSFRCAESKEWTVADLHAALPALVKNSGVCASDIHDVPGSDRCWNLGYYCRMEAFPRSHAIHVHLVKQELFRSSPTYPLCSLHKDKQLLNITKLNDQSFLSL